MRFEFLRDFLKEKGHSIQFDFVTAENEDLGEVIQRLMKEYNHIRVSTPFGEKIHAFVKAVPMATMIQKSSDCLVYDQGQWWARSMLAEGLIREMAMLKNLDISDSALIVGAGASCRAVIAALLKIGYKKFNITEKFEERGRLLIKELKETYFGVDFRFTPQSSITQLPGIHSVVVNTTPLTASNDLLNELYYCNFLRPEAAVIDLTLVPLETPLLKAAKQVGARIVHGCQVATLVDTYWIKSSMKIDVNAEEYQVKLTSLCEKAEFDFSEFEIPDF
jgi:shikimate 5-dehydrogenase